MTISTTTVKNSYSGDGTTTDFDYTFKILADSDLTVIIRDSSGTETTKTLTTHYTLTGVGSASGGTVTFTAGNIPASTETVVLIRDTAQTQSIDYIENDPFPAETHEEGLDRGVILSQELQEEVDRSIKISRTNTMTSTEFTVGPTERAGKFLSFDSNGELVVSQEVGTYQGNWSTGTTYSARDIVKDQSNNNIYLCNTGHTSSGSTPLSTNADIAKWDLLVDAYSATQSAANAATSELNAAASAAAALVSENNSSASESNAATSASNAATSESNASSSATAAATSASEAAGYVDTFDDKYLGSKSSDPTLDNDGDALTDGALYFDTTNNVMKVYDLATTTWLRLTPTSAEQTNINTVSSNISNVNSVASNSTNINTVASNSTNINTVAGNDTNITTVAGISSDVTAVAGDATDIGTVATDLSGSNNIGTVAGSISNVNNVGGSIANVNSVASNLSDVNNFAEVYRISSSAPTTSLDVGDLYFDTTDDVLKVYSSSGWQNAGSSVNGTSRRFKYVATASQTTFSGADANGDTLEYDAGFIDVYLNGVHLDPSDYTATSGTSIVLNSGAAVNDELYVVAFGTFNVAAISAADITSGTLNIARIADGSITNAKLATPFSLTNPTITSISPSTITNSASNIVITGTNYVITPLVEIISTSGKVYFPNTVTRDSATQITINATIPDDGTYFIRVENPDGLAVRSSTALLTVSDAPTWSTAAGSLGSLAQGGTASFSVSASSDSTVSYSVTSGALPTGLSLNSSTGAITGTESGSDTAETTYNFTITATDAESQTADRAFSITVTVGINNGGQFN